MNKTLLITASVLLTFFTLVVFAQNLFLTPQPNPQDTNNGSSMPPPLSASDFANQINAENSQNHNQNPFLNELKSKLSQVPAAQPIPVPAPTPLPPAQSGSATPLVIPAPSTPTTPPPTGAGPNQLSPNQGVAPRIPAPPPPSSPAPSPPPPTRSDVYTGFSNPSGAGNTGTPSKGSSDNWNINY